MGGGPVRPLTFWERFRARFIWGKWSARHGGIHYYRDGFARWIIVGKLRVDLWRGRTYVMERRG